MPPVVWPWAGPRGDFLAIAGAAVGMAYRVSR